MATDNSGAEKAKETAKAATAAPKKQSSGKMGPLSLKGWIGVVIALFSVAFILANWDSTTVSFIFFKATMPLTIALALTFIGGMAAGALLMRRHND